MNQITELSSRKMNPKEVAALLKAEAASNPVFNAVCMAFAIRERARQQVTIQTLKATMAKEGYKFPTEEYAKILTFLSSLGIGRLDRNAKNKVRGLKDIKVTLQSIGRVATSEGVTKMDRLNVKNTFTKLKADEKEQEVSKVLNPPVYPASLTVTIDGAPVSFPLPKGLTTDQLGTLLTKIFSNESAGNA